MSDKKAKSRIYWRQQGGTPRAYADFRDYADVGGKREALKAPGESLATSDPIVAETLAARRVKALQEQRRNKHVLGTARSAKLQPFAAEHLSKKKRGEKVTDKTLAETEHHLRTAISFFGAGRDVASIPVADVQQYSEWLAEVPNHRGGTLAPGTRRHYLNSLSNLFRRAQAEGLLTGVNPVAALMDKPTAQRHEAPWLEVWEAALLLEAARTYPEYRGNGGTTATVSARLRTSLATWKGSSEPALQRFQREMREHGARASDEQLEAYLSGSRIPAPTFIDAAAIVLEVDPAWLRNGDGSRLGRIPPYTYALLATYLLTGGREEEASGLDLKDVSVRKRTITFRPSAHRRLKTPSALRPVPLWPQLTEILEEYLESGYRPTGPGLLFPAEQTGRMITDFRKPLDAVAKRAGWSAGEIRTKIFRHTYCATRLQTLDRGHPVSLWTVAKEMGHGGTAMVERIYGHLGTIRHRSEEVEYRVEQHLDVLAARLARLG